MYWRRGAGFVTLWIASLTLAMSAIAARIWAGSPGAALAFILTAIILAPPFQEFLGHARHKLAPAKAAFFAIVTLLPIGFAVLLLDAVTSMDREAKRLGFASAGHWARARELKLPTPAMLAEHDAAMRKAALQRVCDSRRERPPLECFEPALARSARAFAEVRLPSGELEAVARDALARQRKAYVEIDRDCVGLLDRIDQDALPAMLASQSSILDTAAALWARHLSASELDRLVDLAKPGTSHIPRQDGDSLDAKLARASVSVERELDAALQAWARHLVMSVPSWQAFLSGRTPLPDCKPAAAAAQR